MLYSEYIVLRTMVVVLLFVVSKLIFDSNLLQNTSAVELVALQ